MIHTDGVLDVVVAPSLIIVLKLMMSLPLLYLPSSSCSKYFSCCSERQLLLLLLLLLLLMRTRNNTLSSHCAHHHQQQQQQQHTTQQHTTRTSVSQSYSTAHPGSINLKYDSIVVELTAIERTSSTLMRFYDKCCSNKCFFSRAVALIGYRPYKKL